MTTIKDALISRLKELPEDITLNEILKIIRDEWQFGKSGRKISEKMDETMVAALKTDLEKQLGEFRKGFEKLQDNWDTRGAKGFDNNIWNKSSNLLREILFSLWEHRIEVPIPAMLPCADGSIDINWQTDKFKLLVNIPRERQELVSMYGEKKGSKADEIEVRIKFELVKPVIIEWLRIIA